MCFFLLMQISHKNSSHLSQIYDAPDLQFLQKYLNESFLVNLGVSDISINTFFILNISFILTVSFSDIKLFL